MEILHYILTYGLYNLEVVVALFLFQIHLILLGDEFIFYFKINHILIFKISLYLKQLSR
jgi:hypothetical protein